MAPIDIPLRYNEMEQLEIASDIHARKERREKRKKKFAKQMDNEGCIEETSMTNKKKSKLCILPMSMKVNQTIGEGNFKGNSLSEDNS